jgi:hypothetical protein
VPLSALEDCWIQLSGINARYWRGGPLNAPRQLAIEVQSLLTADAGRLICMLQ